MYSEQFDDTITVVLFRTGHTENLDGMTYRPNTETENNVQENNVAPRYRESTLNSHLVM